MSFAPRRALSLRITRRCRHRDVRGARDLRGHPLASRPLRQRRDRASFAPPSGLRLGANGLDHPRVRRRLPGDRRSRRRHRRGGGRWTLRKGRRDRRKIRRSRLLDRHDRRRSDRSHDRSRTTSEGGRRWEGGWERPAQGHALVEALRQCERVRQQLGSKRDPLASRKESDPRPGCRLDRVEVHGLDSQTGTHSHPQGLRLALKSHISRPEEGERTNNAPRYSQTPQPNRERCSRPPLPAAQW